MLENIEQSPFVNELAELPTVAEITKAIAGLQNNKSPGEDGLPAEIYKHGGPSLHQHLLDLFKDIWNEEEIPGQMKNSQIITIFKNKGSRAECANYRGISLLSVAGKILSKILQTRISTSLLDTAVSESQCGFRNGRGTADMIFAARQLQEKCIEQHMNLYAVFIDLTKAFDTINRNTLWKVLSKKGIPPKVTNILKAMHTDMLGSVKVNGEITDSFPITTGVKQGCIIAPTLFIIYFDAMLQEALRGCEDGIHIRYRTDGSPFNLSRLRAKTKTNLSLIRELLYADDCGIFAHTEENLQLLLDNFARASTGFGLTISISKTEVMYQPAPGSPYVKPKITVAGEPLKVTSTFTYLGSRLANDGQLDAEIDSRIAKASSSFGRLQSRVWSSHDLKLPIKIDVYRAVVLSTLLYAAETWTPYQRHIQKLEAFHQRCLRKILKINWQSFTPNTKVLQVANTISIETEISKRQLKWVGHVVRMPNQRIPKKLLYGELKEGTRSRGRPRKRFKDNLSKTLKDFEFQDLNDAHQREDWRRQLHRAAANAELKRTERLNVRRQRRKDPKNAPDAGHNCTVCGKKCASAAGLAAHRRFKH